ncbi:ephexin-1 [Triplophysa dalaica]|uniref:ephexin-1 n=1 Tax=Triplophysa dalaica TaxID=1582913 RepID=UPI0024DF8405|nr:ephexin-1 [Triplophysa dalaica]XP_056612475.1 ephexin-1 [Triplophysa dalaica]XP_056612476.1 ephexin-1 [Triplophysa dalaica]XP_056612477.1 ephexin-1 [Triplophysa dalaica]
MSESITMMMTALFRGRRPKKSQEASPRSRTPAAHPPSPDEDEDDEETLPGRSPIRRNSRFYRSMRRQRLAANSEQAQSPASPNPAVNPASSNRLSPSTVYKSPLSPRMQDSPSRSGISLPSNGSAVLGGVRSRSPLATPVDSSRRQDMEELSERTSKACTVRDNDMHTVDPDNRLVRNGDSPHKMAVENSCRNLNIVKNVDVLYQEYRDTSKQQEIEQRRQRDGLPAAGSGVVAAPALQLQLRNGSHSLSLWQNLDAVKDSGLLQTLEPKEIIVQEAMFELVSSEASYYKSLELLETHFLHNPLLVNTLSQSDMHFLFSNIEDVMKASERFLMDLEHRIEESILITEVCDIVHFHAVNHFQVFISYVINQVYQEKNYRRILQENSNFRENMSILENQPKVKGLSFTSFLILPFQRITRLKLLVQNILKKVEENSEREKSAILAHQELERIVKECNEGVRKMSRTEELISIEKTLEFKSKSVPVISHSRWLLRKGEVQLMSGPKSTRTMRSRRLYQPIYLYLFNNLLLITKRNSGGEKYQVLDSCSRSMLRTEDMEDQGQMLACTFVLKLLENQEDREVSYMLKTESMSDKLRWIYALTPNRRTRFLSSSTHQPDSPQVQCIQSYSSQEPDELSVEMADVLHILENTDDGWILGERLHDGERGWFPIRVVERIMSAEVRAQNLKECQRIQQAQEGAQGARAASRGRRTAKSPQYTPSWTDV